MATYVCSDIHGLSDKYFSLLNHLDMKQDRLIILGDVIDRGPKGFEILWDALHQDNVCLLMGNHEYMMLEVLEAHQGNIPDDFSVLNWVLNGGAPTMASYRKASPEDQRFVMEALQKLPFAMTDLEIGDRHFYLCHSSPGKSRKKKILYREDVMAPLDFVWTRMDAKGPFKRGKTIVAGHTIVLNYHKDLSVFSDTGNLWTAHYIDIDCGCAMQQENSRLACLCLDTMEVTYF